MGFVRIIGWDKKPIAVLIVLLVTTVLLRKGSATAEYLCGRTCGTTPQANEMSDFTSKTSWEFVKM